MPFFKYKNQNVYYEKTGTGHPLILLHGNTASSKMFDSVIELYKNDFTVIVIDFLGHGKSDRTASFPTDFWYDEAMQVIEFVERMKYNKVNLIGTSGGALVAINIALERSDLVHKIIADSFEGENALDIVAEIIEDDRSSSKQNSDSVDFWIYNHGADWEQVVDNDTTVTLKHYAEIKNFFHKDLSTIQVPALLTFSTRDEFAEFIDLKSVYGKMTRKAAKCEMHIFDNGGHPAMITNAKEFSAIAVNFLKK